MKIPSFLLGAVASLGLLASAAPARAGGEVKFESRPGQRTCLLELYTSEGCSSCPPAESWLSKFVASPKLWTEIVPVAFHVDYWDNLGWRDRFASAAWTARQRAYAQAWGSSSVYTPGVVLDGREWEDWRRDQGNPLPGAAISRQGAGQLTAAIKDGKTVTIVYRPVQRPSAGFSATVALLGSDLNSSVKAGENRGRSLRHDFVALSCETRKLSADQQDYTAVYELRARSEDAMHLALAVWVEEPGRVGVQQAVGGWLSSPPPALP